MNEFTTLLMQGNAWMFIPSAILLGALHGLEPGHSKTMMAAFIVAVRGTLLQAVMLGIAATISHTAVVWAVAMGGLYLGQHWNTEITEPFFQLVSAVIIIGIAAWMIWRTAHPHQHEHNHDESRFFCTEHGDVELRIVEDNSPPFFQIRTLGTVSTASDTTAFQVITTRDNGDVQTFQFRQQGDSFISTDELPEPHQFKVVLQVERDSQVHIYTTEFSETPHHDEEHSEYQDAHEREHADQIRRRFSNRNVTTGQIVLFGLTGGLIPCPASITVLILCLQLKQVALGATLVLSFSIGLALTLVASGVIASLGVKHLEQRGFTKFTRNAPYFSGGLMLVVGLYLGWHGASVLF